ncbi:MAG: hypothetical protein OHK0029_42400 [Armatimonadaceae bacterium]
MTDELEAAIRELEAKLPDLRRLMMDTGDPAASPTTLALMARLLRVVTIADETASHLRVALLGGTASYPEPLPSLPPVLPPNTGNISPVAPPAPEPPAPLQAPPDQTEPEIDTFADASALSEADADLAAVLGLNPESEEKQENESADSEEQLMLAAEKELQEMERKFGLASTQAEFQNRLTLLTEELLDSERDEKHRKVRLLVAEARAFQALHPHLETPGWIVQVLSRLENADYEQDDSDDFLGGALVGAVPTKPMSPRDPGNARTFAEAEEPPRNP